MHDLHYRGKKIYLIGIGGIGMSALARYYKAQGAIVVGSDATKNIITDGLRKENIRVHIGHAATHITRNLDLVIYNRAIRENNPELKTATRLRISTLPYAKALGQITETHKTIAITGSHGKSTTTAFTALALIRAGLDPTVLIGTNLREFGNINFRRERGSKHNDQWLVLEADDFGGAFFEYSPVISIITNIDKEHMDFYKTFANVKTGFLKFMATTRPGGTLILNHDDAPLRSLKNKIAVLARKKELKVIWYSIDNAIGKKIKNALTLPGNHNVSNAAAVYALAKALSIPEKKTLQALHAYHGSWRRMELRGALTISGKKLRIYDDYAHHPSEIKATLQAFREQFSDAPLVIVFQPHQAERLRLLFSDFVDAFTEADTLILIPAYQVTGRDKKMKATSDAYTSERLANAIIKKYPEKPVYYLAEPKNIRKVLVLSEYHGVLIMMGAGDIVQYTDSLVK
jgi:UDP-N-acetylmuramate--alanine ligase